MLEDKTIPQKRGLIYILGFLFTLANAVPAYINSSFIASFLPENLIGIVYTASSIIALVAFVQMPKLLRRFGNFRVIITLLSLCFISLIGLITGSTILTVLSAFMINFVTVALINFCIDIFLESFSPDSKTGGIRGIFLTAGSTAWLLAPVLASLVVGKDQYINVFMLSAFLLMPVTALIAIQLRDFQDPQYSRVPFWKGITEIIGDRDIKSILFSQILLQFFYAWMIIYLPLYLHQHAKFDWDVIGLILGFMLVPFLFEAVLGKLADTHGEKKILSIGFVIMGITAVLIGILTNGNPYVWAILLFASRIGAAMAETMIETYFFKHVDASKSYLIGFSRMGRPTAYVISPIAATLLFLVADMHVLFIVLGVLMLYGLRFSLSLRDTV